MEYPQCIMITHDASRVLMMHQKWSWGIRFVTKWNAMEVERISTKPISMIFLCASLQISRFAGSDVLFVWVSIVFYAILKGSKSTHWSFSDHRGSIWMQSVTTSTILCWSDFSRNQKSWKSTFECFLWQFSTEIWSIDAESTPGHLQPSIYIKNSRCTAQAAVMLFKLDKARNLKKDTHAKPSKWPAPHYRSSGLCHRSGFWQRDNYKNPTHGQIEEREFK